MEIGFMCITDVKPNTPHGFEVFSDIMKENFIKNYPLFEKKLLADKIIYDKKFLEASYIWK